MRNITILIISFIWMLSNFHLAIGQELTAKKIEQNIDSLIQQYENTPGIAIGIVKDGEVVYKKGIGIANLDYGQKLSPQTIFDVGSLAMQITAACIVLLENEGEISFDDPVRKYLPELPDYNEGTVTINHLLNHSSGIRDYLVVLNMSGKPWNTHFDNQDAFDIIKTQTSLGMVPGQEYEYSNSNYMLLSRIVKEVSGKSLPDYAKEKVFDPLEMSDTFFYENANRVVKNRAIAYTKSGEQYQMEHIFNNTVYGDGRLYTTVDDFIKWMINLDNSTIGNQNFVKALTERGIRNDTEQMSYAKGLDHGYDNGSRFYGHNGYWGGFSAMMLKFPESNLSLITMANNSEISAPAFTYQVARYFLPEIQFAKHRKQIKLSKKQQQQFCRNYITYKTGYLREVIFRDDTLRYVVAPGVERVLEPLTKNKFRMASSSADFTIEFDGDVNEKTMLIRLEGLIYGIYKSYTPVTENFIIPAELGGDYYADELEAQYKLEVANDRITVFVNEEEMMKYLPIAKGLYCSESTHHGYLVFDENNTTEFTLNDYSLKKVKFKRKA